MSNRISLRMAGIIVGAAAVFAFLFGLIIAAGTPVLTNRLEASPEKSISAPIINEEIESPFAKVVELISPSVVNISAERKVEGNFPGFEWHSEGPFDEFFRDFFKNFPKFEGKTQTLGSGFLISEDGYVVTNYHVINGASNIVIKMINKQEYKNDQVKIIGTDKRTDIVLLKIESKEKLPFLKLGDSDKVKVGDWAIACGNPFHLEGTVTVGVISAKGRTGIPLPEGPDFQSFLQTDAAINPGNSGGPLVNIRGEVIGMNTAITSPSGGNVGIGFAIPVNLIKNVMDELKIKGRVTRGYLGIYLQDITEDLKAALNLPSLDGVLISEIIENSPASRVGFKSGDVVIEFDGEKVKSVEAFRMRVAATRIGKNVLMKIIRDGKEKTLEVTIGELKEEVTATIEGKEQGFELGQRVIDVTSPQAQQFDLKLKTGVVVIDIKAGSPAENAGIEPGDVILVIGKKEIRNLDDYQNSIGKLEKGKPVIFQIQRAERKRYVTVTP